MSVICQTFVQNAWRSDLCSNCFKSLEDHSDGSATRRSNVCEKLVMPRYVPQAPSLYQSRGISTSLKWRLNESLYDRVSRRDIASQTTQSKVATSREPAHPGILVKSTPAHKKFKSRPSVDFAEEEALVIGYGGNDYDSDTSPWEMGSDDGSIDLDLLDDTDEDRKITKLTRNNTEFNSFNKNLTKEGEKTNATKLAHDDTQASKKLNQYFFPSCTEIKSFLNGKSLVGEEAAPKNNKTENIHSKVMVSDNFTPLNTRTYSFVSEINKNNASFEQSSDSDYSTYRHTAGDSTDSESFHDAEDVRPSPKSSFLHSVYGSPQINGLDIDKKYDAGSSTSGDISNFSDDSDTHESTERKLSKQKNSKDSPIAESKPACKVEGPEEPFGTHLLAKQQEHVGSKIEKQTPSQNSEKESTVVESKHPYQLKNAQKDKTSPTATRPNYPNNPCVKETNNEIFTENKLKKENSPETGRSKLNDTTDKEILRVISKSPAVADKKSPDVVEENKSVSKNKDLPKHQTFIQEIDVTESNKSNEVVSNSPKACDNEVAGRQDCETNFSDDNFVENCTKEHSSRDKELRDYEDPSDYDKSPDAINKRQSKLAALALELELARRDSEAKNNATPPEVKVRHSAPSDNYPTIKKVSAISCASRLSTLPDVLQETPAKQKKTRFSLKKLLKRNKESGTFSPSNSKEVNPKAWKKQTFDRNRLSLEIVHPMDLTSDVPTSADSTPTEPVSTHPGKFMFRGVTSRARSLSALPQLYSEDQSGCALLECRKMDTVPTRKAGTVAERKKNRPALVRTPSCSALPNRPASSSAVTSQLSVDRALPPKPPPPPKCKAIHPPPPPPPPLSHPRLSKTTTQSPARPPPPKVPELKSRVHSSGSSVQELDEPNHSVKEYANLGDIRSLLTPKKPQRPSALSAPARDSEMDKREGIYETLPADEEDHYTYLDEAEVKASKQSEQKAKAGCGRPWLDLQTSYAAIAAANYESLAELITTSLNGDADYFRKAEHALKWSDFVIHPEEPCHVLKEKAVYNAVCRKGSQEKVTLVVAPKKLTTPQNARNQTRYPVLAVFNDHVPKNFVSSNNYILQESEMASVYILQQSNVTTVSDFAKTSSMDVANQYIHLRNYCFVLLQLIHTLKSLQADGIEEINHDLQILALVVTDREKPPVLVLFPGDKVQLTQSDLSCRKTLCQATLETMLHFLQIASVEDLQTCTVNGEPLADPVAHTFRSIAKVLSEEKASSLSQAKGFLEYMLWGPVDVKISQADSGDVLDTILQRWLDLQRAQMVKSTISNLQSRKNLHVYEEYQLIFLLQASVKSLKNVISKL